MALKRPNSHCCRRSGFATPGHGDRTSGAPASSKASRSIGTSVIETNHDYYGLRRLLCEGQPTLLFTENETNTRRLYGDEEGARYVKDSFHDYVVHGDKEAVNPDHVGTKAAAHYVLALRSRRHEDDPPALDATTTESPRLHEAGFRCRLCQTDPRGGRVLRQAGPERCCPKTPAAFSDKPLPDSSGASSSITTM